METLILKLYPLVVAFLVGCLSTFALLSMTRVAKKKLPDSEAYYGLTWDNNKLIKIKNGGKYRIDNGDVFEIENGGNLGINE